MITDNDEDSDVAPMAAVVSPSVALRFKEYRDVVVIPYNNSEDYRQLSVAAWVYCEKDASCSSDPCYLLAKKGSFALGLRSDEIAMAFHNKVHPVLRISKDFLLTFNTATRLAMDWQQVAHACPDLDPRRGGLRFYLRASVHVRERKARLYTAG
jgi:hypothetical protein